MNHKIMALSLAFGLALTAGLKGAAEPMGVSSYLTQAQSDCAVQTASAIISASPEFVSAYFNSAFPDNCAATPQLINAFDNLVKQVLGTDLMYKLQNNAGRMFTSLIQSKKGMPSQVTANQTYTPSYSQYQDMQMYQIPTTQTPHETQVQPTQPINEAPRSRCIQWNNC